MATLHWFDGESRINVEKGLISNSVLLLTEGGAIETGAKYNFFVSITGFSIVQELCVFLSSIFYIGATFKQQYDRDDDALVVARYKRLEPFSASKTCIRS